MSQRSALVDAASGIWLFQIQVFLESAERFADPFGLTHMLGNVREWVQDGWEAGHAGAPRDGSARSPAGNLRTVRGGSYRDNELQVRSSSRASMDAGAQDNQTGFRVLRELGN